MKLFISKTIYEQFPDLRIGILIARGIDNIGSDLDLEELKSLKAEAFKNRYTPDTLLEIPAISAWREAYRIFGVNPKKNKPTAEAMLMRLLKGNSMSTISKAVDLYLIVETEFYLPIGGYDKVRLSGDIILRHSSGGEKFTPIGCVDPEETNSNEIIYADEKRVLTRNWNYRDCDECKITSESKDLILMTEAPSANIPLETIQQSLERIKIYMEKFCGGTFKKIVANPNESLQWDLE